VKRFPVADDREFEIAGEVFKWVYPYWEDIAAVFDRDVGSENGEDEDQTVHQTIEDFIERVQLFIDPEQRDRWVELTKRKKNPIPHSQYSELYRWLLETTSTPTPTEQPSPLEDGQQPVATT
jgi:hypothetical protein